MTKPHPARLQNYRQAKREFGDLIDRLAPYLYQTDPLADATAAAFSELPPGEGFRLLARAIARGTEPKDPPALIALIAHVQHVPVWVDRRRMARAGRLLFRSGVAGGFSLGAKALLAGYCSPGGNKPLVYSGRLYEGVSRRIAETSKFVAAVSDPAGMTRHGEGLAITLKVRMIHAQIRQMIQKEGSWQEELWGAPINQHDMLGTILMFSVAFLEGIRALGVRFSMEEADDYVHLWRYIGYVIGVEPELLPASEGEARRLAEVIYMTQGAPDQDSRDLVHAFLSAPLKNAKTETERREATRRVAFSYGLARGLMGEELSNQLALPSNAWRFAVPMVKQFITRTERLKRWVPGSDARAVAAGRRHWRNLIELGMDGMVPSFELPSALSPKRPLTEHS